MRVPSEPAGSSTSIASTTSNMFEQAQAWHRQGQWREAEAAYRRVLQQMPHDVPALHWLGLMLYQCGRHAESAELLLLAAAGAPADPEIRANLAVVLQASGQLEPALAACSAALQIRPDYPEALNTRGNILRGLRRLEAALADYERALALRPSYPDALSNRASVLVRLGLPAAALASTELALRTAPGFAPAWNNRGIALVALGRYQEALDSYAHATQLNPSYGDAYFNQALCLLLQGEFRRGWALHEWRWRAQGLALQARQCARPLWLGQGGDVLGALSPWPVSAADLSGKTILLHAEQGYGDTLQFCRFAPELAARGARVLLEVQPPLRSLVATLPDVEVFARGDALPAYDLHSPLLSLPHALGITLTTLPTVSSYLRPDAARSERWRTRFAADPRPLIGLAWCGNPAHANDRQRSIPLAELMPLSALPARFVSLQPEVRVSDREAWIQFGMDDVAAELGDFSDSAALLACVDHVVTVDSAVAHLAGALGRPTHVLLPHAPDFRWLLARSDTPWYPSVQLLRQTRPGDWADVIAHLLDKLSAQLPAP